MKAIKFFLFCFLILSFLNPIDCQAKKKTNNPNKKQQELWQSIENSLTENNLAKAIEDCKLLIDKSNMYDSIAILARQVIAEYNLTQSNLSDIYESYLFFRNCEIDCVETTVDIHDYKERCSNKYNELLKNDINETNYEGIYFSDMMTDEGLPYIAFVLGIQYDGTSQISVLPGCQLYKEFIKYASLNSETGINMPSILQIDENVDSKKLPFLVQWGAQKAKDPHLTTAKNLTSLSGTVQSETLAAIESMPSSGSIGKDLGATLIIGALGTLLSACFDWLAGKASQGKIESYALGLSFGSLMNGEMPACVDILIKKSSTKDGDSEFTKRCYFRLYKMFPHYELAFNNKEEIITYRKPSEANDKLWSKAFSPFAYKSGNYKSRNKIGKKYNGQMYQDFVVDHVFQTLREDTIRNYIPDKGYRVFFNDNSDYGQLVLSIWDDKTNAPCDFQAVKKFDGSINYCQYNNGESGLHSVYAPNGNHYVYKEYDKMLQGKFLVYDNKGILIEEKTFADGKLEGRQKKRIRNGELEQRWEEGKPLGNGTIIYDNGDIYNGEIIDDLPNGKGTIKFANGSSKSGFWDNGHLSNQNSSANMSNDNNHTKNDNKENRTNRKTRKTRNKKR